MAELLKRIWSRTSAGPPEPPEAASSLGLEAEPEAEPETGGATPDAEAEDPPDDDGTAEGEAAGVTMKRPSKRATAAEMRGELARLGLDSRGKRETLHR